MKTLIGCEAIVDSSWPCIVQGVKGDSSELLGTKALHQLKNIINKIHENDLRSALVVFENP